MDYHMPQGAYCRLARAGTFLDCRRGSPGHPPDTAWATRERFVAADQRNRDA